MSLTGPRRLIGTVFTGQTRSRNEQRPVEVVPGVYRLALGFVNAYLVQDSEERWAVLDTGTPGHFDAIQAALERVGGAHVRPEAVYLTHGHYDHAGSAVAVAAYYDIPIYAHRMELPYLDGRSDYPPLDPTVPGLSGLAARFLRSSGFDLKPFIQPLPDGALPGLDGWQALETPGHTPGHISFFRPADQVLIAGDACGTVSSDRPLEVLTQSQRLSRPSACATPDWISVRRSLRSLAKLKPRVLACGHGIPLLGENVPTLFAAFSEYFSIPLKGRYVSDPARFDENGIVFLPPKPSDPLPGILAVGAAGVVTAFVIRGARRRAKQNRARPTKE